MHPYSKTLIAIALAVLCTEVYRFIILLIHLMRLRSITDLMFKMDMFITANMQNISHCT